ncbi:MAG: electron transfer flavoprotein subunit alpha/FixB family protein [Chloroflexi bacterium]|nr:electron transfer flavoprotein subunit alpha/FixB family protein [Chloroflexota bacterium]
MPRNVLVVGELSEGAPTSTTIELVGAGSRLAGGGTVAVTLLGNGAAAAAAATFPAGATKAFTSDDANYDQFRSDQWLAAVESAFGLASPDLVLMAQSLVGRELAPRLAFRHNTAAAMDCVHLADDGGTLKVTRPVYGGNALATFSFATSPAVATVRAKSQDPIEPKAGASGETAELPAAGEARAAIIGREKVEAEGLQLQDAPVVVSGGRGLGSPDGFKLVEELAAAIGKDKAAVGASRAACDLGWYPPSQQVGLTGKVVTPDLYIAVAISGASQHMAGCSGSKTIIAINKDPEANIFKSARFGIVGDYRQVLPPLIAAIKAAR